MTAVWRIYAMPKRNNQHVRYCGRSFDKDRAEAMAAAEQAAIGERFDVVVMAGEVDLLPPEPKPLPVQVWAQPHPPLFPATAEPYEIGAGTFLDPLPDEPLMPITPLVDPALIDREEEQ